MEIRKVIRHQTMAETKAAVAAMNSAVRILLMMRVKVYMRTMQIGRLLWYRTNCRHQRSMFTRVFLCLDWEKVNILQGLCDRMQSPKNLDLVVEAQHDDNNLTEMNFLQLKWNLINPMRIASQ
jgi:hypothetical protein